MEINGQLANSLRFDLQSIVKFRPQQGLTIIEDFAETCGECL